MKSTLFIIAALLFSCKSENFRSQPQVKENEPPTDVPPGEGPQTPKQPGPGPAPGQPPQSELCWFAVSGWHYGVMGGGDSNFPDTDSGNAISHGERFDSVGGVFLAARDQAYVYGDGTIDDAVDKSFDSIAVAPGMRFEIHDESGAEIASGNGPMIGIEQEYKKYTADNISAIMSKQDKMPKWMVDYVSTNNSFQSIRNLQSARSVKVSALPGGPCQTAAP